MAEDLFGQGLLDGMPEQLYACTPTRLATWEGCPRRYRFTYLDRPQPPRGGPWAHTSVGASCHVALAQWFALPPARRTPEAGAALLRRVWLRDGFADGEQSGAARARAASWVEEYLAKVDPGLEPVGVERAVSTTTATLVLSGRADRIDPNRDGSLTVVDYKTGRRVPTEEDAAGSLALAVYAVAARRTVRRPCSRVELHHLPSGTVAVAEHSARSLADAVEQAEALGAQASAADEAFARGRTGDDVFPPVTGGHCSWCDFRRHCPQGRAAAPDRKPWDGLDVPDLPPDDDLAAEGED